MRGRIAWPIFAAAVMLLLIASLPVTAQKKDDWPAAKLNLSAEQRDALRKHMASSREKMQDARENLTAARMDFFQQLKRYKIDDRRLQESIRKINVMQRRLMQITLENQLGLRRVLTADQFQQLGQAVQARKERKRGMEGGMWGGFGPKGPDIDALGLSDDQKKRIQKLFDSSKARIQPLATKLHTEMGNLRSLYLTYDLDKKRANTEMDRVSDAEMALLKEVVARQQDLRKILTEDQFNTLARAIRPPEPRGPGGWK